jgi:hypothetical protein
MSRAGARWAAQFRANVAFRRVKMLNRSNCQNPEFTWFAGLPRAALVLLAGLAWSGGAAIAQEAADGKPAKLFSTETALEVTMTAPWGEIEKKKKVEDPYPAKLEYLDENGQTVQLDMTVARRGKSRQVACDFPPIRLRFDKETVKGTLFRGQESLKLTTHCQSSDKYDQYYVMEMLIYRMYNLFTEMSFRTRRLQVTYIDSKNSKTVDERFAFVIEDDSDVAKRNGLKKIRVPSIKPALLHPETSALVGLFEYMIGNVDWASLRGVDPAECCHNIKLMGPDPLVEGPVIIAVPYDFDAAGLVDTPYAAPNEGLPIKKVTQRLYRGFCRHNELLEAARQQTLAQEAAVRALIENEALLFPNSKKEALKYLDDYFETAKDPKKFQKEVIENCRK